MKKIKKMSGLLLVLLMVLAFFPLAFAQGQPEKIRVLIEFKDKANPAEVALVGGKVLHSYDLIDNVLAVEIPVKALPGILQNPNVIGVEEDAVVSVVAPPNTCSPWPECKGGDDPTNPPVEPAQKLPWGVDRIDAELQTATGTGVAVCVVDTGIDQDHPDLAANILGGKNFVPKGRVLDASKWDDDNGHGTHVAGTIAAVDNNIGVVGVAPQTSLLGAKVLDRRGEGYLSDVIAGMDYCVSAGADIISMSLGTNVDVQAMHNAADNAYNAGVLLVAAAGNEYASPVIYPAAYDSVIAVSATDLNNNLASFSNVGAEVELAAPGVGILSAYKDGGYATLSGTSMATPHVSGVAALALELNPLMSHAEIRILLQNTADDLGIPGRDNLFGFGLVDAKLN